MQELEIYVVVSVVRFGDDQHTNISVYDTFEKAEKEKKRIIKEEREEALDIGYLVEENEDFTYYAYVDNEDYTISVEIFQREVE
jgi:IMP cyclohydrolase